MRYRSFMQEQKANLIRQLTIKKALIQKYDIDGYISHKKIGQRTYDYLQYRDQNGEIISVYLTNHDRKIYENALVARNLIDRRIKALESDLELFAGVPDVVIDSDVTRLPESFIGYRMLQGAVGISSKYHVLYEIKAGERKHEYYVNAIYKRKTYSEPLVYVTELKLSEIPFYMKNAGNIIDNAIEKSGEPIKEKYSDNFRGRTDEGIRFSAEKKVDGYFVSFIYKKRHYSFLLETDISNIDDEMKRFTVSTYVKKFIEKQNFEEAIRLYDGK